MSRLKRYAFSLASGYAALAVNIVFTLASVPLALNYLSKAEFGLWALCTQLAGYLALLDFGMSGAQSRILVDYKDEAGGTRYGETILTGFLVGLVQGIFLLVVGGLGLWLAGSAGAFSFELGHEFRWLMLGQCGILGTTFVTRVFGNILWAHQRSDVANFSQMALFAANFAVLWLGLSRGAGVYSLLWGQLVGLILGLGINIAACARLGLFPSRSHWGSPSRVRFRELFKLGKDVFFFALGGQMINTSQTLLVTPLLGLEAAGVWAVCIRPYSLICQLIWRILDFSATPLSEMYVRGERDRFFERFRGVAVLTGAASAAGAVVFAACNQRFLEIWTHGAIGWSVWNDVLLGLWSVLMAVQRCHCGLLGVTKQLGTVKYVYFLEGVVFIGLAWLLARWFGFTGIIASSVIATFCCSFMFGQYRSKVDFNLSWEELLGWMKPAVQIFLVMGPLAVGLWWVAGHMPRLPGLITMGGVTTMAGGWLVFRHGLDARMQGRVAKKLPVWLKPLLPVPGISTH